MIEIEKVSGALVYALVVASEGIILLTSRVSVEMVQKSTLIGASVVVCRFRRRPRWLFTWRMQRVAHLLLAGMRTDSKYSRIHGELRLETLPTRLSLKGLLTEKPAHLDIAGGRAGSASRKLMTRFLRLSAGQTKMWRHGVCLPSPIGGHRALR
jgi:hypothetical protein